MNAETALSGQLQEATLPEAGKLNGLFARSEDAAVSLALGSMVLLPLAESLLRRMFRFRTAWRLFNTWC